MIIAEFFDMVFFISTPESLTKAMPWNPPAVLPSHRLAAMLVIFSLVLPPGLIHGAPAEDPSLNPLVIENAPLSPKNLPPLETPAAGAENPLKPTEAPAAAICIITGEVSDATSLNPVAGAIIDAVGTNRSTTSDSSGKFRIDGLLPGTYTLETSKLGYFSEFLDITAIEAQSADARFSLRLKPVDDLAEEYTLEEETVVGEYQDDSQGNLILDLQLSSSIASGLSKDDFSRSGVSDAGDAVSKIAGANIVGGKYAVVRGLGDRYSNTLVNNALISSADPSKKAVQLDLFPSDLLESVSIFKTFTPDLPAEFAGGTVAIKTLRFPSERIIKFELETGWNSNLSGVDMRTIPGREFDFFGETGDSFSKSAGDPIAGLTSGYTGSRPLSSATAAQKAAAAEAAANFTDIHLSAGMRPGSRGAQPKQNLSLLLGDTFQLFKEVQLGAVAGFTWQKSDTIHENIETGRLFNPGVDGIPKTGDDRLDRSAIEDEFTASLNWGALGSLGMKITDRHELGFTYFTNSSSEDRVTIVERQRRQDGDNLDYLDPSRTPGGAGAFLYTSSENLVPLQRELSFSQFSGKHFLGDPDVWAPVVEWAISNSESIEDRPHSRSLFYYTLDYTDSRVQTEKGDIYNPGLGVLVTAADLPAGTQGTGTLASYRETLKTEETAENGRFDLTFPIFKKSNDTLWDIKIGANNSSKDRQVRGRFFVYETPSPLNLDLFDSANNGALGTDFLESYDSAFNPDGTPRFNGWTGSGARNRSNRLFITEATKSGRTVRNVDAFNTLDATYAMTQVKLNDWDITGGFRFETESRGYEVLSGLNGSEFVTERVEDEYRNVLPGLIIKRKFGEEKAITTTFAWSRTIARPTFYEFAPVQTEDQSTGDVIVGNPDLVDTLIDNYDLRVDWQPLAAANFSLNLFHKSMQNPIAQAFDLFRKTWVNGTEGSLQGIELEASTDIADSWNFTTNYTFINSLLSYEQVVGTSGTQTIDSSYEGQPEHILNLILSYDHEDSGWGSSLVYNMTGSYLTGVPLTSSSPGIRREAFNSLDLILYKKFSIRECDGTVKLKFGNLLDEADTQIFEDTDLIYNSYKPGRSVSLSLNMQF